MGRYLLLIALTFTSFLGAWNETGHLLVAEIAYARLDPPTRQKVDRLVELFQQAHPTYTSLATGSIWPDTIRKEKAYQYTATWHYTNKPYDPENRLSLEEQQAIEQQNASSDIIRGIAQAQAVLRSSTATPQEKAEMLMILTHLVADIHQPLHCTTLYSAQYPNGDRGGNLFMVAGAKNLHYLWDEGLGAFPKLSFPPSTIALAQVRSIGKRWTLLYPEEKFPQLAHPEPAEWAEESYQLGCDPVYQLDPTEPLAALYKKRGRKIVTTQITLAGYRLAHLLQEVLCTAP